MKNLNEIKWTDSVTLGVYILYDRSGSMASREEEAVNSVNSYVKKLSGSVAITIVSFDSENPHDVVRDHVSLSEYTNLKTSEVKSRGTTPLYDATGWIIDQIYKDNPKKAILILTTDGEENASKEYSHSSIQKRISDFKEKGYQVVFLGSEFKNVGVVAQSFGMDWGTQLNRTAGNYGAVSASLASKTMAYASTGASVNWTASEKKALGDDQKNA